ncbi:MAG: CHASE2 domain-containing protein [bacterium]
MENPFVGLRPFQANESLLFFGRREQTMELLQRLHETRFLAVVGSSGSGKSSLIRAGLIPKLKAGFLVDERDKWHFLSVMHPGDKPLHNLISAFSNLLADEKNPASVSRLTEEVKIRGVQAIVQKLALLFENSNSNSNSNLLLLVDQFEEIFRIGLKSDQPEVREEAADFVGIMLGLAKQRNLPIYVVMTMRSDYLGDCDIFYGLPEAMNQSQYLVPRLTRQQRREAIQGPIRLFGQQITPRLLDKLLNAVGDESDQLPVLQHVLLRSWENWQLNGNGPIDLENYRAVGTIENALSNHADEALQGMNEQELKLTRQIFQALTDTDNKQRRIRRPARLSELQAITGDSLENIHNIISRFCSGNKSFLVLSSQDASGDALVDISHESLIRQWTTLRKWVDEEVDSAQKYQDLAKRAEKHRYGEAGLLRDPELQKALEWQHRQNPTKAWAKRYNYDFELTTKFLKSSMWRVRTIMSVGLILFTLAGFFTLQNDNTLNHTFERLMFKMLDPISVSPELVVVEIDAESQFSLDLEQETDRKLWRQYHDDLIDSLSVHGAKAIAFDICFYDTSEYDADLARAIDNAKKRGTAVVFGVGCDRNGPTTTPLLTKASTGIGWTLIKFVEDNIKFQVFGENDTTSFALQVFKPGSSSSKSFDIQLDDQDFADIRFIAAKDSFPAVPYTDIVDDDVVWTLFKNKLVLVGFTLGDLDYFDALEMHGVYIQANAVNTLLSEPKLRTASINLQRAVVMVVTLLALLIFLKIRLQLKWSTPLTALFVTAFISAAVLLFNVKLILLPIAVPLFMLIYTSQLISLLAYGKLLPGMTTKKRTNQGENK